MFKKGINNEEFLVALKKWEHWEEIIDDGDLFIAIRNEYVSVYYQGCSIFKISYTRGQLVSETHYKYLVRPTLTNPYVSWVGESPARGRANDILIDKLNLDSLKKSSSPYAEAEKKGVQSILKSNRNIVDVEVGLSPESEAEADSEDPVVKGKPRADRIDFAAVREKNSKPCIVFFESKRFDNGELKSLKGEPRVFGQIRRYEKFIKDNRPAIEESYRKVCKNLVDLAPNRYDDPLVRRIAVGAEPLTVDPEVRLAVFGYGMDDRKGEVWKKHKKILQDHFGSRFLLKGSPSKFTYGISK